MPDEQDHRASTDDQAEHDPTGLELAQTVARSLGAQARRRRRQAAAAALGHRCPALEPTSVTRSCSPMRWTTGGEQGMGHRDQRAHPAGALGAAGRRRQRGTFPPEAYADTVLTVRADSTAWATQLRYLAPQLVAMLNEQLGDGTITRIKVLGPDAPSWKKGRRSVRDGRGPRDTYG